MKSKKLFRLLPVAAAVSALGLAVGHAHAGAYAVSYNEITNFVITGTNTTFVLPGSVNSSATACLPNANCVNTGGAGVVDAAPAQIGVALANNAYFPLVGGLTPFNYARADASIDQQQTEGGPFTQARAIAEGHLADTNTANATAGNSSGTVFTAIIVLDVGGSLRFQLDADPFLRVFLHPGSVVPSQAEAIIAANISISQQGGGQVFNWSPDGQDGNITGGTEIRDSFSLNTNLLALPGAPGPFVYDPVNCPVGSVATGCFEAVTNELAAGTYVLNLTMRDTINLQKTLRVPEPATLALMSLALVGLGVAGIRRKT